MKEAENIKNIIEAILIVSEGGVSREELQKVVGEGVDAKDLDGAVELLKEEYSSDTRSFNLVEIAGKYRIVTKPKYLPWINKLYRREPERLTGPSLETLAIVAYKQPVTRAEIESIRGVNIGGVLKTLLDKELIRVSGRKDAVGKPLIYGTSEKFLEIFGLNSLSDLPELRDFREEELEYGKAQEQNIVELDEDAEVAEQQNIVELDEDAEVTETNAKKETDDEAEKTE